MGRTPFRSDYLAWLTLVLERLEEMGPDADADTPLQSSGFMLELRRLRRECQLLERTAHVQGWMGYLDPPLLECVRTLLHDLQWLLQVSPSASPALARQCVLMARDRVVDEVQLLARSAAEETAPQRMFST